MEENLRLLAKAYYYNPDDLDRLMVFYDALHEAGLGKRADLHFLVMGKIAHCVVWRNCTIVQECMYGNLEKLFTEEPT